MNLNSLIKEIKRRMVAPDPTLMNNILTATEIQESWEKEREQMRQEDEQRPPSLIVQKMQEILSQYQPQEK